MNNFDLLSFKCPICHSQMSIKDKNTLCCNGERIHTYDLSSSGYVNLASPKQSGGGDTKDAVRARTSFLELGFYENIAIKAVEILKEYLPVGAKVVDAGCGEGYYTLKIAEQGFFTVGFDISKMAVEAAAKRAKRKADLNTAFAVASVFELPIFDSSVDAVVNIFAPCVEEEYSRVLSSGGIVLVVHAGKDHLMGLKKVLYESTYENDERADLPKNMNLIYEDELKYTISVSGNQNVKNLFAMTPYYWRTSQQDAKKLENIEELNTEIDIIFSVFKKETDGR